MRQHFTILTALLALSSASVLAQDREWADTLSASVKTDAKTTARSLGNLSAVSTSIRSIASPLGEGDPIRWTQGMPGVATGADGTTSFYVRGGNAGNSTITVDGVPVYGYSHLLGLTTVLPTAAVESVDLFKGGFRGRDDNFTASHLMAETRQPVEDGRTYISANTFLLSAGSEGRLAGRLSYIVSARISPLPWEYSAVKGALPSILGGLDDVDSGVGDIFGKICMDLPGNGRLEAFGLGSLDSYAFSRGSDERDGMGWDNAIGSLRYSASRRRLSWEAQTYFNRYSSSQTQDKVYHGAENHLSLSSVLREWAVSGDMGFAVSDDLSLEGGIKWVKASLCPGQVASAVNGTDCTRGGAYLQLNYNILDRIDINAAGRLNGFQRSTGSDGHLLDPEFDASVRWDVNGRLALEASLDRRVQYYHTLEGLPLGWGLDMVVPSGRTIHPETMGQASAGMTLKTGGNTLTAGGYFKSMDNLVYYRYAQNLFSGGLADWESKTELGGGRSYGIEVLDEFSYGDWYARCSYTLSKTERFGFASVNDRNPFHARFDRTHVLNLLGQWKGLSATLSYASGQWENGASVIYPMHVLGGEEWTAEYFSGINNYRMTDIFRIDVGYCHEFNIARTEHEVRIGVSNLTNHFNPFMLYFDTAAGSWKQLALLPILPNFSWRVEF